MELWFGSLTSNIQWLFQQGMRNIWLSLMPRGKRLHAHTYIPTFRLSLLNLHYCIATVLRPCYSPMSLHAIKGPSTSILGNYHYIRDILEKGEIQVDYVSSEENLVDVFTKALGADLHHHCVLGMGAQTLSSSVKSRRWGFLVSMLFFCRESHITRWSIYKRFSPLWLMVYEWFLMRRQYSSSNLSLFKEPRECCEVRSCRRYRRIRHYRRIKEAVVTQPGGSAGTMI